MSRSRGWAIGIAVVVLLLGFWGWRARKGHAPVKYRTASVEQGSIQSTVSATGTIRPVEQVQVGSQVSGTLSRLAADYNSRVRKGQVLAQIEPSSFRARELQAEAAVARAEAALADARRGYKRAQELITQQYISQAELETAQATVQQREADLKQARAALEAAKVDLKNTTIVAPIDGVVISRSVDVGQTVAASLQAPQLFVIANDLSRMQVETRIDEADIGQVHPGLPATFTVDAFPDATFQGSVAQVRLEPITEQGVVTYTTVIQTDNPDLKLRPGMTANVTVLVSRRDGVLKVPNGALRFRPPDTGRARGASAAAGFGGGRTARGAGIIGGGAPDTSSGAERRGWRGGGRGGDSSRWAARRGGAGGPMGGGGGHGRRGGGAGAGGGPEGSPGATGSTRGSTGGGRGAGEIAPFQAGTEAPGYKPGAIYLLKDGKPERVAVLTGITDGATTEVQSDSLRPGDTVIVGVELPAASNATNMQPPPGMGGPRFGGGVRGGGGGGRGR